MRLVVLLLLDIVAIPLVYCVAYSLKFKWGLVFNIVVGSNWGMIYPHAQLEPYLEHIGVVMGIWMVCLFATGTYRVYQGILARINQCSAIIKAALMASVLVWALSLLVDLMPQSLTVLVSSMVLTVVAIQLNRYWVDSVFSRWFFTPKKAIVIGNGMQAQFLVEGLVLQYSKQYQYVGSFGPALDTSDMLFSIQSTYQHLGNIADWDTYTLTHDVHHVFLMDPSLAPSAIESMMMYCKRRGIEVHLQFSVPDVFYGLASLDKISDIALISYSMPAKHHGRDVIKRIMDVVGAGIVLLLTSPICLACCLWIKYVSAHGPVIFKQARVGQYGRVFTMYKFRTMEPNSEQETGPVWVAKNDSRYIRGGRWLRALSLDELPQLINVLKNDMSLIGPRPERPYFVETISKDNPYFKLRHHIKGGITGWAQIHGRAYLTRRPIEKLHYDLYYIKHKSLLLDLKICLKTMFIIWKREHAY